MKESKSLSPEWEQMFAQSPQLFMMSSLSRRTAIAAVRAPTSLDVVNIYSASIIAVPSGLEATARWVNSGPSWEINEQCASGSGWEEWLMARGAAQSNGMYLWKRSLRSLTDTSLPSACGSWVQTSPYRQHTGSTRRDWSRAEVTFYQAPLCSYLVKGKLSQLSVCCVWIYALGRFNSLF